MLRTPILFPLRVIPDHIHARFISCIINHLLSGQEVKKRLHELDGKSICINIKDTLNCFYFRIKDNHLLPTSNKNVNVIITGESASFWQLATKQEDPDTLFFRRSLNIEGETETGVHIKNIIDSLEFDWDAHFDAIFFPHLANVMKQCKNKVTHS